MKSLLLSALCLTLALGAAQAQQATVLLADGTVVQGEIVGLHGDMVRLAQEGGGRSDFPWAEIIGLKGDEEVRLQLSGDELLKGRLKAVENGELVVDHAMLGEIRVPVDRLDRAPEIAPAGQQDPEQTTFLKPHDWRGKVTLGITATTGNSDTFTGVLDAFIEKNFTEDHLEFAARAIYGRADGETNQDAQMLRGKWEHYFSKRFYSYVSSRVGRNKVQELELRFLFDVGVGYLVWEQGDKEYFKVEGGLGYRHESFEDDTDTRDDLTGRVAIDYRNIIFEDIEFRQQAEILLPLTDTATWIARSETSISVPVSENWAFNTTALVIYQNEPADDAESTDFILSAGVEYSF